MRKRLVELDIPRNGHFLKPKLKVKGTQLKKSYNTEIWLGSCFIKVTFGTVKKRSGTAAPAKNHRFPTIFLPFLVKLDNFESFETNFFSNKKVSLQLHLTLIFQTCNYKKIPSVMWNIWEFFMNFCLRWFKLSIMARKGKKKSAE